MTNFKKINKKNCTKIYLLKIILHTITFKKLNILELAIKNKKIQILIKSRIRLYKKNDFKFFFLNINSKQFKSIDGILIKLLFNYLASKKKKLVYYKTLKIFSQFLIKSPLYQLSIDTKNKVKNKKIYSLFYNNLMINGNKCTCENLIFKSLKLFQKNSKKNHIEIFKSAIINVSPIFDIRYLRPSKKLKKKNKTIKEFPFLLSSKNRVALALKHLIFNSKFNPQFNFFKDEIFMSSKNNASESKNKTEMLQKNSIINKKFLYFRWSPLN